MNNSKYLGRPYAFVIAGLLVVSLASFVAIVLLDRSAAVRAIAINWVVLVFAGGVAATYMTRRAEARDRSVIATSRPFDRKHR